MYEKRKNAAEIISVAAIAVLFIVILSLVVLSAKSYRFASDSMDADNNTRAVLSYMVNCVGDSGPGEVSIENYSGTECLVIRDAEGFEQRFYEKDGKLMEEYMQEGAELRPEDALEIGDTGSLDFSIDDNGMLTIRTDAGSSCVNTGDKRS